MGNHLDLPAAASGSEHYAQIASHKGSQLEYKATLGGSSFLRTFQYMHAEYGLVVVKVWHVRARCACCPGVQPSGHSMAWHQRDAGACPAVMVLFVLD
jgi:hypothetical protein